MSIQIQAFRQRLDRQCCSLNGTAAKAAMMEGKTTNANSNLMVKKLESAGAAANEISLLGDRSLLTREKQRRIWPVCYLLRRKLNVDVQQLSKVKRCINVIATIERIVTIAHLVDVDGNHGIMVLRAMQQKSLKHRSSGTLC